MRSFAAVLAAALLAAALLPGHGLGIGVPIVALLVAASFAARPGRKTSAHMLVFGALAMALAAMPAVRDAGWVVALDLVAAFLLASVAAAPGARGVELAVGAVAALVGLRDVPAVAAEVDIERERRGAIASVARGTLAGALVALPFGILFWSADRAFSELGGSVPLPDLSSVPARAGVFALVLLAGGGLLLAARRPPAVGPPRQASRLATAEWAIPLAVLDVLFLAFVVVQFAVLFGGHDRVLETAGLTYSEYARQGFVQLLVAAGLTLVVVAVAARTARISGRRDLVLLRGLLGALCLLTLVVLASALKRLGLYEDAFGFTRLRLVAHAIGFWLGGLFVLVLAAGARRRAPWLARAAVAFTGAGLLAFSLANPDGIVAARNVDRWEKTGRIDVAYLASLGADAVPSLVRLPAGIREQAIARVRDRLASGDPWSSANVARARARSALAHRF